MTPVVALDIVGQINTTKAFVGDDGVDNAAMFGYKNLVYATDYAVSQNSTGLTSINSTSAAGSIHFGFGGVQTHTMNMNGDMIITGNIFTYSDARIKTNVELIPNALDKVLKLRGVTYNLIAAPEKSNVGLIAQEVEAVVPQAVTEDVNGTKTVAYGNLVGLLIESIKELHAEVAALKARIQ
jgi:hypothetical protein